MRTKLQPRQILHFYRDTDPLNFLSNVSKARFGIEIDGNRHTLKYSEQAYQFCKNPKDPIAGRIIRGELKGGGIQKEAQKIANPNPMFLEQIPLHDTNDSDKERLMYCICIAKATQNPEIVKFLVAAHGMGCKFVENTRLAKTDPFWGNGPDGNGRNALGKIWGRVARELSIEYHAGRVQIRTGLSDEVADKLGFKRHDNNGLSGKYLTKAQIDAAQDITYASEILSPAARRFLGFIHNKQPLIHSDRSVGGSRTKVLQDYFTNQDDLRNGQTANNSMETDHDYVQWLFPLSSPSTHNPCAPVLTRQDFANLRKLPEVRAAVGDHFELFTKFMGIEQDPSTKKFRMVNAPAWNNWINHPHNYQRITRILKSLVNFGEQELAEQFFEFLNLEAKRTKPQNGFIPFSDGAKEALKKHWKEAVEKHPMKPVDKNQPGHKEKKEKETKSPESKNVELEKLEAQLKAKNDELTRAREKENLARVKRAQNVVGFPFKVFDIAVNSIQGWLEWVGKLDVSSGSKAAISIIGLLYEGIKIGFSIGKKAIEAVKTNTTTTDEIRQSVAESKTLASEVNDLGKKIEEVNAKKVPAQKAPNIEGPHARRVLEEKMSHTRW